ncbi:MAG: sporulation protein YqfD [Bacillota bacterium]|nr:sporulation protein YqfD [Bacillota bacterium]
MKSGKFGFLKHYRRIRIEGTNLCELINKCIKNEIELKNLHWKNNIESTVELPGEEFSRFRKLAGHSCRIYVIKEGGAVPVFRSFKANLLTVAGAFLLGALIFYQSLFIAEIRIEGYRSIDEASIREVLAEAGLYEGVRKPGDYNDVKNAIYENFEKITWVSIYENGRMVKVNIAEAGNTEEAEVEETSPVDIVAERSGIIERVIPLKGNAKVQKGDYVNKGDVLISGRYKYQSTDYSKGDDFLVMYSHAEGQVLAKVPKRLTYYIEKNKREKTPEGKWIPGVSIRAGDLKIDTADAFNRFEASVRYEKRVVNIVKPLPVDIRLVKINQVALTEKRQSPDKIRKVVEAAVRQYARENLGKDEKILDMDVDYTESQGLIKADVLLELLEDIGSEKPVKIKKEEKKSKETTP